MSYERLMREQGPWFRIAYRLVIKRYPCLGCSFALATHGIVDRAFGVGPPSSCADCAKEDNDKEWEPVDPKVYDRERKP